MNTSGLLRLLVTLKKVIKTMKNIFSVQEMLRLVYLMHRVIHVHIILSCDTTVYKSNGYIYIDLSYSFDILWIIFLLHLRNQVL